MLGIGTAHGKFGELLQGVLPNENADFLVTVPILRYSIARFHYSHLNENTVIYPVHKKKSAALAKKMLGYFGLSCNWTLTIISELGEGKGLGSSTADMVACARAITQAIGKNLPTDIFLKFLKEIEPSDGIMYEGVVCFYHRNVVLHSQLGFLSELMIVGVDEGGVVDTINFNQEPRLRSSAEKAEYTTLLNETICAIKKNDLKKIGAIATRSAMLHQKFNPKKNLSFFMEISNLIDALGVMVAHSGTYIGIILDKNTPDYLQKLVFVEKKMREQSLMPERFNVTTKAYAALMQDKTP